jgi:hypothetical protein
MRTRNVLTILLAIAMILAPIQPAAAELTGVTFGTESGASLVDNLDGSLSITEAGGGDMWGTSDTGYLVYDSNTMVGNGEIVGQIKFDTSGGGWSRIGLEFRETIDANARRFSAGLADANGGKIEDSHRHTTGQGTDRHVNIDNQDISTWEWVKVTRSGNVGTLVDGVTEWGNTFQLSTSENGIDWTAQGDPQTIDFASPEAYVGFFAQGRGHTGIGGTNHVDATFADLGGFLALGAHDLSSTGASSDWNLSTTWTPEPAAAPTHNTALSILSGHTVDVLSGSSGAGKSLDIAATGALNVNDVLIIQKQIANSGTITVNDTLTVGEAITGSGVLNIASGGTVNADAASTANIVFDTPASTLNASNLTINSDLNLADANVILNGNSVTIASGSTLTADASQAYTAPTGNLNIQGTLAGANDITVKNIVKPAAHAIGSGHFLAAESGTLGDVSFGTSAASGDATINATTASAGISASNLTLLNDTRLVKNGAGWVSFSGASTIGTGATVRVNAGQIKLGDAPSDLDAVQLNGGTFAVEGQVTGAQAGLLGAHVAGANFNGVNDGSLGMVMGPLGGRSGAEHWDDVIGRDNSQLIYTGQVYLAGTTTFVESIDDGTKLVIDGETLIEDGAWNHVAHATIARPAGWYDIDIRFFNGSGGYGPAKQGGWTENFGFGIDVDGNDTTDEANFVFPLDPGTGSGTLFRAGATYGAIDMPNTTFTVTSDSAISARTDSTATFGALTLDTGIVTLSGAKGGMIFGGTTVLAGSPTGVTSTQAYTLGALNISEGSDVTIGGAPTTSSITILDGNSDGATSATIRANDVFDAGTYNDNAITTGLTHAGAGTLDMRTIGATAAVNTTFTAQNGTIEFSGDRLLGGSTAALNLAGGTVKVTGFDSTRTESLGWDFNTPGDAGLTGWTKVTSPWGANTVFADANPNNATGGAAPDGLWINTWHGSNGNSDNNTGIIRSDSFMIGNEGGGENITLKVGGGGAWMMNGDPDNLQADWCAVVLEREVAPGDWAKVYGENGGNWNQSLRTWDTSGYVGETMRISIYDTRAGNNWAFVTVDDIQISAVRLGSIEAIDLSSTDVNVTADSTLELITSSTATLGSVNFNAPGMLTTTGADEAVIFADTTLAGGVSGFNTLSTTYAGPINFSDADGTLVKTGHADLILDGGAATGLSGLTGFDVREGRLIGVESSNPFGVDSTIGINGGEVVLVGADAAAAAVFDNSVTSTGGILTIQDNTGAMTATIGNATTNNLTLTSGTLTVRTSGDDSLHIAGDILGGVDGGNMTIASGSTVTAAKTIDTGSITIESGASLTVNDSVAVRELISNAGSTYSSVGTNRNLTATQTLTLDSGLDMTGATLNVDGANVTVNNGTLTVENSLGTVAPVASVDVSNAGALTLGGSSLTTQKLATTGATFEMVDSVGSFIATGDIQTAPVSGPSQLELTGGAISISAAETLNPDTLAYYSFDQADNLGQDSAGAHHGQSGAGASFNANAAVGDGALQVTNADDGYINVGNADFGQLQNNFTIAAFINPDATGGIQRIFGTAPGGRSGLGFGLLGDDLRFTTFGVKDFDSGNIAVPAGQWSHIAVSFGANNQASFYLNGTRVGNMPTGGAPGVSATDFFIGRLGNNPMEPFAGLLDEFYVIQRALNGAEINDLYSSLGQYTVNLPDTNLLMTADTIINVDSNATLGNLTVNNADAASLSFAGGSENRLNLNSTTFSNPLTGLTVDVAPKVDLGAMNLAAASAPVIEKLGAGELIITKATANFTGDAAYNVTAGTLTLGDTNLLNLGQTVVSTVNVGSEGVLKLSSSIANPNPTYTNANEVFTFADGATILAGKAGASSSAAAVVTLPSIGDMSGKTINLGSADASYTLKIDSTVTAATIATAGVGTVTLEAGGIATTAINVTTGTLNVGDTATIAAPIISVTEIGSLNMGAAQSINNMLVDTTGTVNISDAAPLTIGDGAVIGTLTIGTDAITIDAGNTFQVTGANVAAERTLTLQGGTLTVPGVTQNAMIWDFEPLPGQTVGTVTNTEGTHAFVPDGIQTNFEGDAFDRFIDGVPSSALEYRTSVNTGNAFEGSGDWYMGSDSARNADGTYTYQGNNWPGMVETPIFRLGTGGATIDFMQGGGNQDWLSFQLVRASDNAILFDDTHQNHGWDLNARTWDATAAEYQDEEVYLRLWDEQSGDWGFTFVDNVVVSNVQRGEVLSMPTTHIKLATDTQIDAGANGTTVLGDLTFSDAGRNLTVSSGVKAVSFGNVTLAAGTGDNTITGAGMVVRGNMTAAADQTLSAATFVNNGGTVDFQAGSSLNTSTITHNAGTTTFASGAAISEVTHLTVTGGTLNASAPVTVSNQASIGDYVVATSDGINTFSVSGADVLAAHTLTLNGGTMALSGQIIGGPIDNIASMSTWLDASDASTLSTTTDATGASPAIGGNVAYWGDKGDGAQNATNTIDQPSYEVTTIGTKSNVPVVRFESTDSLDFATTVPGSAGDGSTVFMLYRLHTLGNWKNPLESNLHMIDGGGGERCLVTGGGAVNIQPNTVKADVWAIQELQLDQGDYALWLNGDAAGTHGNGTLVNDFGGMGGGTPMVMDVAELLVFDGKLSATDHSRVGDYLADKYGLSSSYANIYNPDTTVDLQNTTVATTDDSTVMIATGDSIGVNLGGIATAADTTLTINSSATDITMTNMTLGGGSMVLSSAATSGASDVTMTVNGTLTGGNSVADIGEMPAILPAEISGDSGAINLTLTADSTYEWTFVEGVDTNIDVTGMITMETGATINLNLGSGAISDGTVRLFRSYLDEFNIGGVTYDPDDPGDLSLADINITTSAGMVLEEGFTLAWSDYIDDDNIGDAFIYLTLTGVSTDVVVEDQDGDADNNQTVDEADMAILLAQFGSAYDLSLTADFNGDGYVDMADFVILRANWGAGTTPPEASELPSTTPEPATMTMLALGAMVALGRRRRK